MKFEVTEKTWIVATNLHAINSNNETIFIRSEGIALEAGDSVDLVGDIKKFETELKWREYCEEKGINIISVDGRLSSVTPKLPENPFIVNGPRSVK